MRSRLFYLAMAASIIVGLWPLESSYAAQFFCPSGNVPCLIAAINEANWNGVPNTIFLEAGTYTLQNVNNNTDGPNGLPSIKGTITIRQNELAAVIERDPAAPPFRLFHVDSGGSLTLFGLALRYGRDQSDFGGGAISNRGVLKIDRLAIYENTKTTGPTQTNTTGGAGINNLGGQAFIVNSEIGDNSVTEDEFVNGLGGGIFNGPWAGLGGEMEITRSFIHGNRSVRVGGGIFTGGSLKVTSSAIYDNVAANSEGFGGGGGVDIQAGGVVTFSNSTIARNGNAGVSSSGEWTAINSTFAGNGFTDILLGRSRANVQNSIVGGCFAGPDFGTFNSLGHNIIDNPAGCQAQFQPTTDMVTDPRLGEWNPDGGYFPLLPDSPAIDSANANACSATDQLGNPRLGVCDRGSVEFQGGRMVVSVDIRPRRDANRINPSSSKNINVAIFSVNGFDAASVDSSTVRFGATGVEAAPIRVALKDIDEDGHDDMVLRFQIHDTGIKCGDTSALLAGQIFGGTSFIGLSPLTTVQCKQKVQNFVSR